MSQIAKTSGVLLVDRNLSLLSYSPAIRTLLGLEEAADFSFQQIETRLPTDLHLSQKVSTLSRSDSLILEKIVVLNHQMTIFVFPLAMKSQDISHFVVIFHDMSLESDEERAKGDFTAMMVHELRAPLTVISGTADMFLEHPQLALEDSGKQLLLTMKSSSGMMLNLVTDLLDIAKIESGNFQIYRTLSNLQDAISERVLFFKPLAEAKQISVIIAESPRPLYLAFDRERIAQVLNNLLSNAVKFTPSGGVITIAITSLDSQEDFDQFFSGREAHRFGNMDNHFPEVAVSIANTGSVISTDQVPKLFSKFQQLLHSSEDGHKGSGLGLVVVRGIIESHQGAIFVDSHTKSGTTFSFTLPVA